MGRPVYETNGTREGAYARLAEELLGLCPLRAERDVCGYLEGRGLRADAEAAGLGALPGESGRARLVSRLVELVSTPSCDEATTLACLHAMGLLREGKRELAWPDHRLLIPWRDRAGRITSLQRRLIAPASSPKIPKYVFPAGFGPSSPYGSELFDPKVHAPVILTEGAIEVLARRRIARGWSEPCQVLGVPSASTLFARTVWEPLLLARDLVLAFDADAAGDTAAAKFAAELCGGARSVTRERLTGAKDFGEAVLAKEVTR